LTAGEPTRVTVLAFERGDATTPLVERPAMRFGSGG
jgi:hypothetical protein